MARSGAEISCSRRGGGSSKKCILCGRRRRNSVAPSPWWGGVVQKSVFGGGVAPDFVAPYLQGWGSSIKCIFGGGTRYSASNPPPQVGELSKQVYWGGRVRRVLIAPTPRGNKRSPRHSAPSMTKNALASAPLRARSPCHSAPPVTKNALDSAPLRATPRHPLFPLGATKTGAPPPPKYTCLDDPHFRGVAGGRKSGAILQNTLLWRTPLGVGSDKIRRHPPPNTFFRTNPPTGGIGVTKCGAPRNTICLDDPPPPLREQEISMPLRATPRHPLFSLG